MVTENNSGGVDILSEEEKIAEVSLPPVKVPADLKKIIDELKYLRLKGDKLRLYNTSGIMREALLKGLRLMLLERAIYDTIIEKEARAGAERLYTSLNIEEPVEEKPQVSTGAREALEGTGVEKMREEEETEEPEEEEEEKEED